VQDSRQREYHQSGHELRHLVPDQRMVWSHR
jgi:hypothetical protein